MYQLASVRTNRFYLKEKEEYKLHHEIVILVDTASYRRSTELDIVREREIKEFRFTASDDGFRKLVDHLQVILTAKDEDFI